MLELVNGEKYLEIGLGDGHNFSRVNALKKVSIDPDVKSSDMFAPNFVTDSDTFFKSNQIKFDLVFIDGGHEEYQVERDLENALEALTPRGAVVCHDLNPTSREMQTSQRQQTEWTGDGWKAWVRLRGRRPDLAMTVVEADYGVGIILPGAYPGRRLDPVLNTELTWDNLVRCRREWLHLLTPVEARYFVVKRLHDRG